MGQAQSGVVDEVKTVDVADDGPSRHGPSRHGYLKVPADQLIPPNIVIDDPELLQAVQRRIGRGVLAPFFPPTEDEKDEECPICCDHFRDLNWFTCCKHPICSECFVRLWQERLEAMDTDIECPFCKQPKGDAHLRFIKLSEKAKKQRRKAEEESVHAQKRAQQKEREREPLSPLNATRREQLMWAPASLPTNPPAPLSQNAQMYSAAAPNTSVPNSPHSRPPEPSAPESSASVPSRSRSRTPPPTSAHANVPPPTSRSRAPASAHDNTARGYGIAAPPKSNRLRTPSAAPATARELALEVESAVLERSYHGGSREPSMHGGAERSHRGGSRPQSREPSMHGGEGGEHSHHGGSRRGSREPSMHGRECSRHGGARQQGREPSMHGGGVGVMQRGGAAAEIEQQGVPGRMIREPSMRGGSVPAQAITPRGGGVPGHIGGEQSTRGDGQVPYAEPYEEDDGAQFAHQRRPSGCFGGFGLSREHSRDMSTRSGYDRSCNAYGIEGSQSRRRDTSSRSARYWPRRRGNKEASQRGNDALSATAREHSGWAPNHASGNLSGDMSSPDARTTATADGSAVELSLSGSGLSPAPSGMSRGASGGSPHAFLHRRRASESLGSDTGATTNREPSMHDSSRHARTMGSSIHRSVQRALASAMQGRSRRGGSTHHSREPSMHAADLSQRSQRESSQPGSRELSATLRAAADGSTQGSATLISRELSIQEGSNQLPVDTSPILLKIPPHMPRAQGTQDMHAPRPIGGTDKSRTLPPVRTDAVRAAHAAQARMNKGAAPAGAVRPGHGTTLHDHLRNRAQKKTGEGSVNSTTSRAFSAEHAGRARATPSPDPSVASSKYQPAAQDASLRHNTPPSNAQGAPEQKQAGTRDDRSVISMESAESHPVDRSIRRRWNLRNLFTTADKSTPVSKPPTPQSSVHGDSRGRAPTLPTASASRQTSAVPKEVSMHGAAAARESAARIELERCRHRPPQPNSPVATDVNQSNSTPPTKTDEVDLPHHPKPRSRPVSPPAPTHKQKPPATAAEEPLLPVLKPSAHKVPPQAVPTKRPGDPHKLDRCPSRKAAAEMAAAPIALSAAFSVRPPESCSAAPMPRDDPEPALASPNNQNIVTTVKSVPQAPSHVAAPLVVTHDQWKLPSHSNSSQNPDSIGKLSDESATNFPSPRAPPSSSQLQARLQDLADAQTSPQPDTAHQSVTVSHLPVSPVAELQPTTKPVAVVSSVSSSVVLNPERDLHPSPLPHTAQTGTGLPVTEDRFIKQVHVRRESVGGWSVADSAQSTYTVAETVSTVTTVVSQVPRVRHIFAGKQYGKGDDAAVLPWDGFARAIEAAVGVDEKPLYDGVVDVIWPNEREGEGPIVKHQQGVQRSKQADNLPPPENTNRTDSSSYRRSTASSHSRHSTHCSASLTSAAGDAKAPGVPTAGSVPTASAAGSHELAPAAAESSVAEASIRLPSQPPQFRIPRATPSLHPSPMIAPSTKSPPQSQLARVNTSDQEALTLQPHPDCTDPARSAAAAAYAQHRVWNSNTPGDTNPPIDPVSTDSSRSLSDDVDDSPERLYTRAAKVATGVMDSSTTTPSVVLADDTYFSFDQSRVNHRTPSGATLYTRIAQAATGVEAEVASGGVTAPLHQVASDPDLHRLTQQPSDLSEPLSLHREMSSPIPVSASPSMYLENSMHGSSVSGGEHLHASHFAEAMYVAKRVAAAAGGASPDVSMHGLAASAGDSSGRQSVNARMATGSALHRDSALRDGSSAGVSSLSFGDDLSMRRWRSGAARSTAQVARWDSAVSPSDRSHGSSASFGSASHTGRYASAARVASGVSAAAVSAGDSSSAGASSLSFGEDLSINLRGSRTPTARTSRELDHERALQNAASTLRSRAGYGAVQRSPSWRLKLPRRTGSMHSPSRLHSGSAHDRGRRSLPRVSSASYAQSVAAGVIASVSGEGSVREHVEFTTRTSGAVQLKHSQEEGVLKNQQRMRASHRNFSHRESRSPRASHASHDDEATPQSPQSQHPPTFSASIQSSRVSLDAMPRREKQKHACSTKQEPADAAHAFDSGAAACNHNRSARQDKQHTDELSSDLVFTPDLCMEIRKTSSAALAQTSAQSPTHLSQHSPTQLPAVDLWRSQNMESPRRGQHQPWHDRRHHSGSSASTELAKRRGGAGDAPDRRGSTPAATPIHASQPRRGGRSSESRNEAAMIESPRSLEEESRMHAIVASRLELSVSAADMHGSNTAVAHAGVRRSAKGAFQGKEVADVGFHGQRGHGEDAQRVNSGDYQGEEEGAVKSTATMRILNARRRKRQMKEAEALKRAESDAAMELSAADVAESGSGSSGRLRYPAGAARSAVCMQPPWRDHHPQVRTPTSSSNAGIQRTTSEQRQALEEMLPPGVLGNILEQAGDMDEEELADFLHAFELSCQEDGTSNSNTAHPRAVCENSEHKPEKPPGFTNSADMHQAHAYCKVVSSSDEGTESFYEDAVEDADEISPRKSSEHREQHQLNSTFMLKEDSRSMSKSDVDEQTPPETTTPRSEDLEDLELRSPRSKLVHECELALDGLNSDEYMHAGRNSSTHNPSHSRSNHSSKPKKSNTSSSSHWWPKATSMYPKHAPRRCGVVAEAVQRTHEDAVIFPSLQVQSPAADKWLQGHPAQRRSHGDIADIAGRMRRDMGAVIEGRTQCNCIHTCIPRTSSFDFCVDDCYYRFDDVWPTCMHTRDLEERRTDSVPAHCRPTTLRSAKAWVPCIVSPVPHPGSTRPSTSKLCDPQTQERELLKSASCCGPRCAWVGAYMRREGGAVCEAYSDEEEEQELDGAELFRDEGEAGPQGPDVPEGAVAGVIVMQPDGSPCIGWLLAHPAIANLSDTMRQALVTLNVVHARDLKLQTRIACDDDRIMHAISRHDRALVVDENHPEHYQAERASNAPATTQRTELLDSTTERVPSEVSQPHVQQPVASSSSAPPRASLRPQVIDDSHVVAAIARGDRFGHKPYYVEDEDAAEHSITPDCAELPQSKGGQEQSSTEDATSSQQESGASMTQKTGGRGSNGGGEDWLERMRRRDAELQARIAQHDSTVYGNTD